MDIAFLKNTALLKLTYRILVNQVFLFCTAQNILSRELWGTNYKRMLNS